jgi:exopolysaccharide biosynthesis polyprenyl glycosylphosphotransferase
LVEKINPSWLIFSDGFVKSRISRVTKRFVGVLLSTVLLIVFSPLILVVAVAIKLDSRGSAFFSQERVGEYGKIFTIHKFRSMEADAEEESGPVWAEEDDSRVTRVGRILRKLRIDELPQLWNVFKGDMSFVGPRPERSFFVEKLKETIPYYNERLSVKPGVTGWAQIKYAYSSSEEEALEKLKYDLYYIKNMSIVMDLIIIFHTVKIVLLGRGSR